MIELLTYIFSDHTIRIVALGACILGLVSGCLGSFAVLRQQSLLGDAVSHATLPGVALAFMLTGEKNALVLLIGAGIAGWIGTLMVMAVTQTTRIKKDTGLGIVLSVFFGFGIFLLTIIQRMPSANKAGLNKYLFGSAATLLEDDVKTMGFLAVCVLTLLFLLWKEFKAVTFDYDFAKSVGLPTRALDILLTTLIVIAIVTGLQTVGVVLMSAMLVAPAAAARQWTNRLSAMVVLSALFGATAGMAGALTSSVVTNLPTGPTIVLFISGIVFISLFFAPMRGLFWDFLRNYRHRRAIRMTTMLSNLMLFSEISTDPFHAHDISALRAIGRGPVQKTMSMLERKGFVKEYPGRRWALTPQGLEEAKRLVKQYEDQHVPRN